MMGYNIGFVATNLLISRKIIIGIKSR